MNLKEIKGLLITENMAAVRDIASRRDLFHAFTENQIRHLIKFDVMGHERMGFTIDHAQLVEGAHDEALSFVQAIDKVMQSEAAAKFNFNGQFFITIETDNETIAFLIIIEKGNVSYQETEYAWPDEDQKEA